MADAGFFPPTLTDDDATAFQRRDTADVRIDVAMGVDGVTLGEDLVLLVENTAGRAAWHTTVCDGSGNHLATLAVTADYPTDAVLTAAIATAKAAFPDHVRIPRNVQSGRKQPRREAFRG